MNNYHFARQSVKTFFQGVNWENRPNVTSQSLGESVQDYFMRIPWSGMSIAQSSPEPLFSEGISKSDTLEDFLNDIKFFTNE